MALQIVTCTNSCQLVCNQFALESIRNQEYTIAYSYFQQNQFASKNNTTAVDRRQLHYNVVTTARRFDTRRIVFNLGTISLVTQHVITTNRCLFARNKLRAQ